MKRILWMKKILSLTLLAFFFSILIVSAGTAVPVPIITQAASTTTIYLDPPTINGTDGQEFTVNIMIRNSPNIAGWQAGLLFNHTLLNCTGFFEGEFLKTVAPNPDDKIATPGTINNTAGVITPYGWVIKGEIYASGSGRLAYVNFTVKASGVSDLHLSDVELNCWVRVDPYTVNKVKVPTNIIDVYTVAEVTPPQTVVIESNSTSVDLVSGSICHSGFYAHAYNPALKAISFNVTGPYLGWSNVTIPKELLEPEPQHTWAVLVDGTSVSRIVTPNTTHTSVNFTYSRGIHEVQVTTRFMSSNISIALSSTSIAKGDSVTISGGIDPAQSGVNVEIMYKLSSATKWTSLANVTTNQNGNYSYPWTPTKIGTYNVKAKWKGTETVSGAESDELTLTVKEAGINPYIIVAVVVVIIIIAAIALYFVKFRKPKPE